MENNKIYQEQVKILDSLPGPGTNKNRMIQIGMVLIAIVICGLVGFSLTHRKVSKTIVLAPQLQEQKDSLNDFLIVYSTQTFSTLTQSWETSKEYMANVSQSKKIEVNPDTFAHIFLPSGKKFIRHTNHTIETSINGDPTSFKKIVDNTNIPDTDYLDDFFWSKDENTIAYNISIRRSEGQDENGNPKVYAEEQYYTINFDGNQSQLVGKITNYPGGFFVGFDFSKSIVYATEYSVGPPETKTLVALDTKTNQIKKLITIPQDMFIVFSSDFSRFYYSDDNKTVTSYDLHTDQKNIIFDSAKNGVSIKNPQIVIRISPDDRLLFIGIDSKNSDDNQKFILNISDNSVDTSLLQSKYKQFSFDSFSPDSRYIAITSQREDIPDKDPNKAKYGVSAFYSGKFCMWDIKNKKIIPFINCNPVLVGFMNNVVNENIFIVGWMKNIQELRMHNNVIPTATPTPTVAPDSSGETDFYAKTNNIVRRSDINALINAIDQYTQDHRNASVAITSTLKPISKSGADICSDIIPAYMAALPRDPAVPSDPNNKYSGGGSVTDCASDYDTGFTIMKDSDNHITIQAPHTEQIPIISITNKKPRTYVRWFSKQGKLRLS